MALDEIMECIGLYNQLAERAVRIAIEGYLGYAKSKRDIVRDIGVTSGVTCARVDERWISALITIA